MFIAVLILVSALIGGYLGWRRGTSDLYARSFDPMRPAHGTVNDELARRKGSRLVRTALYALAGPVVAIGTLFVLVRQ